MPEEKNQLVRYGIFTGILVAMLLFLILFSFLAHRTWSRGLRHAVTQVLDAGSVQYVLGDGVELRSKLESQAAAYHLAVDGQGDDGSLYAVIVRVTTTFGPLPAVYVYDDAAGSAQFVGYANLRSRAAPQIEAATGSSAIDHWARRVPQLMQTAVVDAGEDGQ